MTSVPVVILIAPSPLIMPNNNVAAYPQVLSAFAGAGGLDLAVRIIAPGARTVAYIEREARTAVNLVARMEEAALDPAPVWDEIETFNGHPWREKVDWIIASPPCQPFSSAGKKQGDRDHRAFGEGAGPLAGFLRIIDEIRPAVVFLENVSDWVTDGWFRSFGDVLAGMGYSIPQPVFLAAEDLGFTHRRKRVYILAYTESFGMEGRQCPREGRTQRTIFDGSSQDMGNTHGERRRKAGGAGTPEEVRPSSAGAELADANGSGAERTKPENRTGSRTKSDNQELANAGSNRLQGQCEGGPEAGAAGGSGRADLPLFPPGSGIDDISEWLEIFNGPDGWRYSPALPKSRIRGMVDGLAGRVDRLRLTGEGVVPVVAAVALAILLRSADIEHELWENLEGTNDDRSNKRL